MWLLARPHLMRALARDTLPGRWHPEDILTLLLRRKVRLWIAWDPEARVVIGAVVTRIYAYPSGMKELQAWLVGGDRLKDWLKNGMKTLEEFGRAQGCAYLTGGGPRKGWLRLDRGFRVTGIALAKAL